CTITGFSPTYFISTTSTANPSFSASSVIAFPPYLMTIVLPANVRMYGSDSTRTFAFLISLFIRLAPARGLQNKAAEIVVLDQIRHARPDIGRIHAHVPVRQLRRIEQDLLEQPLHDREEPTRADVLTAFVHRGRRRGDLVQRVRTDLEYDALGLEQRAVLGHERAARLRQDPDEVRFRQRLELNADRKPALQLRNQVRRLRHMKRAGRDEQNMVRLDRAILRIDRRTFHDRQEIPLHPFARDIGAGELLTTGNFIDFVQKYNAGLLDAPHGFAMA